jgi:hypothetical protein
MGIVLKNVNITGGKLNGTVEVASGGAAPSGRELMKTGQTTSFRTGDDGDLQEGRDVDFFTLDYSNPFGNTNRFTDELGGTAYANNWVIDWSTFNAVTGKVLGYFRTAQPNTTWFVAIDNSLGTFGTFSGCRLPNITELYNIINFQNGNGAFTRLLEYAPFNIIDSLWSSTTLQTQPNFAWYVRAASQPNLILYDGKGQGASISYIPVRTFTVTGTTLT